MRLALHNWVEANSNILQENACQYYRIPPSIPSFTPQEPKATAIEDFQIVDNDSHDAEDFETTSQQITNVTEKWDGEDEKDDVEDNLADADKEETNKLDSKTEIAAHQLPEKKPLVESTAESEA